MTPLELAHKFEANMRGMMKVPGSATMIEQQANPIDGQVRWWKSTTLDLVRTADGGAWLFIPLGKVVHPPLFGLAYRNCPADIITSIASMGGAVFPAELDFAKGLELRLVAGRR